MGMVNKKYVVLIDNSKGGEYGELCYMQTIRKKSKSFCDFTPVRSKAHHFTTKASAEKCSQRLKDNGYASWVETFYML